MIVSRFRRIAQYPLRSYFSTKDNDPKIQWETKKQILKQITPYVLPFKSQNKQVRNPLLKSYVYLALSRICLFGGPVFLKYAIDTMKTTGGAIDPLLLILGYGTCYIGSTVFVSFRSIEITKVSYAAMKQVSLKLYKKLLSLPKNFFAGRPLGDTLFEFDRAQNGLSKLIKIMNEQLLPIGFDIVFGTLMLLYYFSVPFALTFISTFGLYAYFTFKYNDDKRNSDIKIQRNAEKKLSTVLSEAVRNYQNVKYYSAEKHQISKYHQILKFLEERALITNKSLGILNSGQRIIFGTGLTINLMLAAHYAKRGLVAVGDVVLIQTLMLQLFNPLNMLGMMYQVVTQSFVDIKYFIKLMKQKPEIVQSATAKPAHTLEGKITFKNVSFHYPEKTYNILMNKSFEIRANQFVGLMGVSGSGKSTSLNLIFRTLDPTSGEVLIDDKNIKDLTLQSFRNQIAVVSQTPYLFNDTILNNILYCNETSTKEDVIKICKALDLHDYIVSLPDGYDTYVGDQGSLFSGGQKQRISICRGLLQNKKIVLLDEPLSALDKENAKRVIDLLKTYKDCTRIMVTHHQQYAQDLDRTIYLDKN